VVTTTPWRQIAGGRTCSNISKIARRLNSKSEGRQGRGLIKLLEVIVRHGQRDPAPHQKKISDRVFKCACYGETKTGGGKEGTRMNSRGQGTRAGIGATVGMRGSQSAEGGNPKITKVLPSNMVRTKMELGLSRQKE